MEPGRALDALIAEKVMGYLPVSKEHAYNQENQWTNGSIIFSLEEYSTDIAAAWQVVEKIKYKFHLIKVGDDIPDCFSPPGTRYKVSVTIDYGKHLEAASSHSMSHAISLAALKCSNISIESH